MALEKVSDILNDADKNNYGVIALNTFNYESIKWMIEAAEEMKMPCISMLYPSVSKHIPMTTFVEITKDLAKKTKVPVGLHLDHSNSFEIVMQGIRAGFQSVLLDASMCEYDENLRLTQKVVEIAHLMGVDVEAELGRVGSASDESHISNRDMYTNKDLAKDFVQKTDIEYLAISIGSAHGIYVKEPKLDIELLKEIKKEVKIPLVLHGGSGIPFEQVSESVNHGICKINVGTLYNVKFKECMMKNAEKNNSFLGSMNEGKSIVMDYLLELMKVGNPNGYEVI